MKQSLPTLYLYNNVIFPQTLIPLTISDGVSKTVLIECFERDHPMLFYHLGNRVKKIGTIGKILTLEHQVDKSVTVLVQGVSRVKLLTQEQHLPYPIFDTESYNDKEETAVFLDAPLERLYDVLSNWLQRHISSAPERSRFLKELNTPQKLINGLCLLVIKDVELKEIFLSSVSLPERIRLMDAVLRGASPEIEDNEMSEAIKKFESLEHQSQLKNIG